MPSESRLGSRSCYRLAPQVDEVTVPLGNDHQSLPAGSKACVAVPTATWLSAASYVKDVVAADASCSRGTATSFWRTAGRRA